MDLETRKRAVDVIAQLVVGGSDKGYFTVLDELLDMIGYESLERERDLWRTKYEAIRAERDKALPYSLDPQQQTCKVCGRPMKLDFHVDDATWKAVVPEEHQNHAICLYCFDELAASKGIEVTIDSIHFAGKAVTLNDADELCAACAEMREALELAEAWAKNDCASCESPFKEDDTCQFPNLCTTRPTLAIIQKALSSDAGKDLLERLHEAEELLSKICDTEDLLNCCPCDQDCYHYEGCQKGILHTRIQTFLKRGEKNA